MRRRRHLLVGLAAAGLVLAIVTGVVAARLASADADRIPAGVAIAGIPVGGLSSRDATRLVAQRARPPRTAIRFTSAADPDLDLSVPVSSLSPRAVVARAVRRALERPSLLARIRAELGLGAARREIPLGFRVEEARAGQVAAAVAARLRRPARSAGLRLVDREIVLDRARPGRSVDEAALARRIRRLPGRVEVPVRPEPPAVSDAEAESARRRALLVVATTVVVSGEGERVRLEPDLLRRALRFSRGASRIVVRIDPGAIAPTLEEGFGSVRQPPRDAGFRVEGDRVVVTPSRAGREADVARVARLLVSRPARRTVRAPFIVTPPQRSTAQARAMRIREPVSEFATPYACCPPRVTNIRLAAEILDGAIIPAGGTFSLNEALGERTAARGFVPAPQINAGMLEDAVGGGVSQIATTIYNAAFFAGLEIVSHTPHEYYIGRYPPGREATVSFGGPELVVRNDWPAAVLISARADPDSVTFRLFSSTLGRRVETESGPAGAPGAPFSISYTRKVFRRDELVRDERYRWTYRAAPAG